MFRVCLAALRPRSIHPRAFAAAAAAKSSELRASVAQGHRQLRRPVVLEDMEAAVRVSETSVVTAREMWHATCVARESKHTRRSQGACVVGGARAIRRIWREYGICPRVVYVPSTEAAVPAWCLEESQPTYIVLSSPVEIKRQLLSAEYSDGYAAEFPWDGALVAPAALLFVDSTAGEAEKNEEAELNWAGTPMPRDAVRSMVVLVGLRIPSNAGMLIRGAVDMGYDSILLIDCVDPFQEKVVRASEGTVFSPALRIFEADGAGDSVALLSGIAQRHGLLPVLAVPSQDAEPALGVAKRFHFHNANVGSNGGGGGARPFGAMLVLGSESQGLHSLGGSEWRGPHQVVTLPLPNPEIDSFNVTVAGSILLNMYRPGAQRHFAKLAELAGETEALLRGGGQDGDGDETPLSE